MSGGIVDWYYFDVDSDRVPDEVKASVLPEGGRGRILALAATPHAESDRWAARAALALVRSWSESGLRVVLMDLGLERPILHDLLDFPNEEGVSDAFLYGASMKRVARPAMDGTIFFTSAGTATADPAEVLEHPRWNDLAGGFSEADATLVLYLPVGIAGAEKILSLATDIVFLAAQGESADAHLGPATIKVVASVGPMGSPLEEEEPPGEEDTGEVDAGLEEPVTGLEERLEGETRGDESSSELPPFRMGQDLGAEEEEAQEDAPEEDEDLGGFDFGAELELADDFGAASWDSWEQEDWEGEEDDEVEGVSEFAESRDFTAGPEEEEEEEDEEEEEGEEEEEEVEDDRPSREAERPTFEEDLPFEERSPLEPEALSGGEEGAFGDDLVQGADFGPDHEGAPPMDAPEPSYSRTGAEAKAPRSREEVPPEEDRPEEKPGSREEAIARAQPAMEERRRPPVRRPPKKKLPWGRLAAAVLLLGVLGAAAGTAFGLFRVPGFSFLQGDFERIPDPTMSRDGPEAVEPVLRYSLVLLSYAEAQKGDAEEMRDALRARLPELLFTLVPQSEDGNDALTYVLLAGPARDRLEAENLRGPLSEVLTREDSESWTIRPTPRGFLIGEESTLNAAAERTSRLAEEGLPAYTLQVSYPDSTRAYRVYSGAHEGLEDARPLWRLLWARGHEDAPLVERRGDLPE